jgi:LysM repeat protein
MGGGMDMGGQCSSYHVVKAGEGLFDIGRMYHKTPAQMLAANPDVMNNKNQWVYVGQKICIP